MCVLDDQLQQRLWVSVTSATQLFSSCSALRRARAPRCAALLTAQAHGTQSCVTPVHVLLQDSQIPVELCLTSNVKTNRQVSPAAACGRAAHLHASCCEQV